MQDIVTNDEVLYRCVFYKDDLGFEINTTTGTPRVSHAMFNDRQRHPSVDRAKLRGYDPTRTQISDRDGVISLLTKSVREIAQVDSRDNKGRIVTQHLIDVIAKPERDNPAHAEIHHSPEISSPKAYKRLKKALAHIANERGWLIQCTPMSRPRNGENKV